LTPGSIRKVGHARIHADAAWMKLRGRSARRTNRLVRPGDSNDLVDRVTRQSFPARRQIPPVREVQVLVKRLADAAGRVAARSR